MLDMSRKIIIIGKPKEEYSLKVIFVRVKPFLSAEPAPLPGPLPEADLDLSCCFANLSTKVAVILPAVAPTRVPLEPAQTPNESDHQ